MNSGGNFVPWCSTRTRAWVTRRFLGVYPGATRSPSHPSSVSRFFFKKKVFFIVSGISIWLLQTSRLGSRRWTFPSPFPSERSQRSRIPTKWAQYIIYSAQNISYVLFRIFFIFWTEYIIYSEQNISYILKGDLLLSKSETICWRCWRSQCTSQWPGRRTDWWWTKGTGWKRIKKDKDS